MIAVGRHAIAGLTALEFAIVLAIIGAVAYVLLRGLVFAEKETERLAFNDNQAALERALAYELMSRGTRGETQDPALLTRQDPFQWLERKPLGWAGDYPAQGRTKPGAWYWDGQRAEVVYIPQDPERVKFAKAREAEIRLSIKATGSGNVRLMVVTPFAWR
uniref:Type II secretion system protein n=1 Tax=uncultured bacterium UPO42 TaxID=1776967 RepID=A0A126SXW6_9BACT|nr:hypothetical protein Slit_2606 [uncultured bacterium UPO42]